ncbi:hypothetical protein C942_01801 [Photobacterium marinum]|uniref:Uncharacterized protein n=1 Tax=Photobacterium marinum TaxID=1056511 RepID=L8JCJ5_9GAMM|nr:hypothetical protein C942_01801 [Photobacterium marinum]
MNEGDIDLIPVQHRKNHVNVTSFPTVFTASRGDALMTGQQLNSVLHSRTT